MVTAIVTRVKITVHTDFVPPSAYVADVPESDGDFMLISSEGFKVVLNCDCYHLYLPSVVQSYRQLHLTTADKYLSSVYLNEE